MAISSKIFIRKKGNLTLPVDFRRKYGLAAGDVLTIADLGDGTFLLSTGISEVERLADRVEQRLSEAGVTLDELLVTLDEEREQYYHKHYASG